MTKKRPVQLCVVAYREDGSKNREPFYVNGDWVKGGWLWEYAKDMAAQNAEKSGEHTLIAYDDGPVVGGVVPHRANV